MGSLFSGGRAPAAPTPAPMPTMPGRPDTFNVDQAQARGNAQNAGHATQQAAFNRINQVGPYGSIDYRQTGTDQFGNPTFQQTTTLDPNEVAFRQQGQGVFGHAAGGLAGVAGQGPQLSRSLYDPEGLVQAGANRLGQYATPANLSSDEAFNRAYDYATANLEPRFQRTQDATINRLRNQGLDPTSEAYRSQMNDLSLQQNEARNNLVTGLQGQMFGQALQERQQGLGEAAQLFGLGTGRAQQAFGQDQAIAGLANQSRGIDADIYGRLGSLGIAGAGSAMTAPGVSPYANVGVQNVDAAGLEQARSAQALQGYGTETNALLSAYNTQNNAQNQSFNNQMRVYEQQQQQRNAMLGGLASIAGSVLAAPMTGGVSLGGLALGGIGRAFTGGAAAGTPYDQYTI